MEKKNVKGLDNYYYYEESLDTTFVLTGFKTSEQVGNVIYYVFTPVYGSYDKEYYLSVAYFESFDAALIRNRLFRIEDIHDIVYNFEQE